MSRFLQDYVDVTALHELDVLQKIATLTQEAILDDPTVDNDIAVDTSWRASIDVYGTTLQLNISTSNMMPSCVRERLESDRLVAKIVGMVPKPKDIYSALPLSEPELCVLILSYHNYGEIFLDWEFYVRDKFLKLPSSKRFRNALAAQKLRVETP